MILQIDISNNEDSSNVDTKNSKYTITKQWSS